MIQPIEYFLVFVEFYFLAKCRNAHEKDVEETKYHMPFLSFLKQNRKFQKLGNAIFLQVILLEIYFTQSTAYLKPNYLF